jgi:hypothetical protein
MDFKHPERCQWQRTGPEGSPFKVLRGFGQPLRALTGGDPKRADVVCEIALLIQERLGDRRRVCRAASAKAGGDGDRIRDRILKGEEHAVLNELQSGSLDLDQLADSRDLDPTW